MSQSWIRKSIFFISLKKVLNLKLKVITVFFTKLNEGRNTSRFILLKF